MLKLLHTSDWHLGWATRAAAREQQATDEAALKLEEAPTFGTPGISERRTALEELRELACCAWLNNPASLSRHLASSFCCPKAQPRAF